MGTQKNMATFIFPHEVTQKKDKPTAWFEVREWSQLFATGADFPLVRFCCCCCCFREFFVVVGADGVEVALAVLAGAGAAEILAEVADNEFAVLVEGAAFIAKLPELAFDEPITASWPLPNSPEWI